MGRAPCCDKANVKRGPWSPEEDAKLKGYIEEYGTGGNWIALPQKIGLKRCGKSCRLRWLNYLRPNIKHGGFSEEEESIICSLYMTIGSRWSIIAAQLPGRTDNDIKNYWNTRLKKKLIAKQRKEAAAAVSRLQINNQSQLNHDQVPSYDLPVVHAADSDHMTVSQQEHPHLANQMLEFDQYLRFLSTQDHPLSKNCIDFHHDCPPSSSTSSSIPQLIQQDQYQMDSLLNATMNNSSNIYTQDMQYYFDSGTNISGGGYPEMAPQGGGTINLPLYDQHLLYHDAAAASLYNDNYLHGLLDGVVAEGLNSGNASSSTTTSASVEETTASLGPEMSPMLYQPPGISSLDDVCQQTRMLQLQQGGFIMESAEYSSSNAVV